MRIVDSLWFSNCTGTVGVIIVDYEDDGRLKAKIGVGKGQFAKVDADRIAKVGSAFPLLLAQLLIYGLKFNEG